ncbi:ferredoxin--NADP reductase [Dermatobacter hominis]|uniref:ferredoxin--NADP reductase n=1 Tax=Dermatobacter hominis TaxID=2884263 RepID=UPI001D101FB8|nr:ferredoxin--NADP reductase [Dermatobacter hominis]UDY36649.1 ferredoxin--NADP reductase [Dermatobacter hominis]
MAVPAPAGDRPVRDHGFHRVPVARVVAETEDARSFVLDVPPELRPGFAYRAGQFCTFRVHVEGATHLRCYSMSSAPEVDPALTVTVKRVPGGVVSNWLIDSVRPGDELEVTFPAGVFQLAGSTGEVVGFAAGSGITPIISLVRSALATTGRHVRLLYANRDRDATIFARALDELERSSGGRLRVEHRWDVEHGFVDAAAVRTFVRGTDVDAEVYVCGPTPFMDVVESTLLDDGVARERIHIERFTPAGASGAVDGAVDTAIGADEAPVGPATDGPATDGPAAERTVRIEVEGRSGDTVHHEGTTLLQTARELGLDPPSSCESGSCATCMARLVEGTVTMHVNDALTDEEVADGWVLTCQSVPTSDRVHVVYGYD